MDRRGWIVLNNIYCTNKSLFSVLLQWSRESDKECTPTTASNSIWSAYQPKMFRLQNWVNATHMRAYLVSLKHRFIKDLTTGT
jgi:hypothetical protein